MDDKLFLGARSSLFVSGGALGTFAVLAVLGAVFHVRALCAAAAFLFVLCLVSRLWGESALRDVSVHCESAPAALFPPGEVTLRLRIKNDKLLPVIWLEVVQLLEEDAPLIPAEAAEICRVRGVQAQLEGAAGEEAAFLYKKFTFLMGGEELTWESRWNARRRGIFHPGRLQLRAGDGFGLSQREQLVGGAGDPFVAVYPAVQPVSVDLFLKDMWEATSGASGYLEDPTIIKSTRDYARTDAFKRINWRMTARSQRTVVNTYETILPKSAHFIVDGESFNGPRETGEAFEDMLSILTSLILRLEEAGIQCGVSLPRSREDAPRELLGAEQTPLEEILTAFAGYRLRELVGTEEDPRKLYVRPAEFRDSQILSLRNVGRFYYVCSALDRVEKGGLVSRLDPARTVLLPYTAPSSLRESALQAFSVVGLNTLKRGAAHAS